VPTVYRVLGQLKPGAASLEDIYTVLKPARSAILSSINICNQSATPTSYRISVAIKGAADSLEQYLAYDAPIVANDTVSFNVGVSLAQDDVVRVYATLATLSFNVFGLENA
jgi:hypothetical protein